MKPALQATVKATLEKIKNKVGADSSGPAVGGGGGAPPAKEEESKAVKMEKAEPSTMTSSFNKSRPPTGTAGTA